MTGPKSAEQVLFDAAVKHGTFQRRLIEAQRRVAELSDLVESSYDEMIAARRAAGYEV